MKGRLVTMTIPARQRVSMTLALGWDVKKPGPEVRTTDTMTKSASSPDRELETVTKALLTEHTLKTIHVIDIVAAKAFQSQLLFYFVALSVVGCQDAVILLVVIVAY